MKTTKPRWLNEYFFLAILLILLLIYYLFLMTQTIKTGSQTPENLYYLSKLMLELNTPYFYFVDFNTNQPPLPYFAALLFRNPYAATIATGVFFALFVYWLMRSRKYVEAFVFIIFSFFFLYMPLLYLFTSKLQIALYFFLFSVSNFFIVRFLKNRKTYDIFYFGLLYGLSYFVLYEAFYLLPIYLLVIFICTPDAKIDQKMSLALVAFMPVIFMLLSWSYLCWIFTGRVALIAGSTPIYLRFMVYTPFLTIMDNLSDIFINSFKYTFVFYALLPLLFFEKGFWRSPLIYIYMSPLFLLMIKTISWGAAPEFYEYTILILIIPVVFYFYDIKRSGTKNLLIVLLVAFLIIGNIAFFNFAGDHENQFARALSRQQVVIEPSYYLEISELLNDADGRILMDDDILHPVIIYTDDVTRFILPYNLDFKSGLNKPGVIADFIVMAENPYIDRVAAIWPPEDGIPGYTQIFAEDGIYLFSKD